MNKISAVKNNSDVNRDERVVEIENTVSAINKSFILAFVWPGVPDLLKADVQGLMLTL